MAVRSLAYLGLGSSDPDAWMRFATEGLGLMDCGKHNGVDRLRMDGSAWRIAVHPSSSDDILYAGFDVGGKAELDVLADQLEAHGIPVARLDDRTCHERGVESGIATDHLGGVPVEIVHGLSEASQPFASSRVNRFVTGAGGLGHFVLSIEDLEAATHFLALLGFSVSDHIDLPVDIDTRVRVTFLHCNRRHHSVALAPLPGPKRLDHLMVEVPSVDEVVDTYYHLLATGYTMTRHLGRHPNDGMLSFYVESPAGFAVELGCDGIEIDDGWEVRVYDRMSKWGHRSILK